MTEAPAASGRGAAQAEIDRRNISFWNELCGSTLARKLGISDLSRESLQKFDRFYFRHYPYLDRYVGCELLAGCDVLEIGLGYGLVAQKLVEAGARYVGLDIASGSVAVARKRFALHGLQGTALQGSVLDLPFRDESFDAVVTIGCLHHTGDLKAGVDEVYRVLRPGGRALVMVYNAFSYRRWLRWPLATLRQLRSERSGEGTIAVASTRERRIYDPDSAGGGAPETVFTSVRQLARLCSRFRSCRIRKENAAREHVFRFVPRPLLLPIMGPTLGLDLYAQLTK